MLCAVALTSFGWTIILSTMQGKFDKADAAKNQASDELTEARLAVVGTSYDAASAHLAHVVVPTPPLRALESPVIPPLAASLPVVPSAAEAGAPVGGKGGSNGGVGVKAHAAVEPRLWELYCKERRA